MACIRRSLITSTSRARLLFAHQRLTNPSISSAYVNNYNQEEDHRKSHQHAGFSLQSRSYSVSGFRDPRWSQFIRHVPVTATTGVGFYLPRRNMSTNVGTFNIDYMINMADKTMDNVVSSTQAVYNEVAIAAADSWLPVAAWMDALDGIHKFTGVNWWATIVIATVILRTCTVHSKIHILKVNANIAIMKQQLQEELDNKRMSEAVAKELMQNAYLKHVTPCLLPLIIRSFVYGSFYFAIYSMVGKIPSFETGGASWFLNLTTADPLYTLPVLYSYTFWLNLELNIRNSAEYLQGNRNPDLKKNARGVLAVLMIPLCSYFPKAFFFYMITSNVYSFVFGLTIRQPAVRKFLNIPIVGPPQKSPGSQSKHCHPSVDAKTLRQEEVRETKPMSTDQSTVPSPQAIAMKNLSVLALLILLLVVMAKGSTSDMAAPRKQMRFRSSKMVTYCCSNTSRPCSNTLEECKKYCKTYCY
ncbi:membrane insertase [Artemisia annua]|uniref:Membrane insertase n=1 Tax=Artemisia annua TaxID=35608 RepID=A0A2U1NN38_ARTAN|nr:membrane insertase [Artemisia annua]